KCLSCTGTKKPKMDGTQCNECNIPGCTNCDTVSQCAVCGDGYRHNANTCQKCTPEHCKACINDVNTCTTCSEGYKLEGEVCVPASTNKSGLSTGAIAGISVAAVVVVGGLVGFLCWCLCATRRNDTRLGSRQSHPIPAASQETSCNGLPCRCPLGALSTPDSSPCGRWATGTI
ncbi:Variant-specific surface protein, partial [Giardia duodenalis]